LGTCGLPFARLPEALRKAMAAPAAALAQIRPPCPSQGRVALWRPGRGVSRIVRPAVHLAGPIFEPESVHADPWRSARALFAAGFRPGDVLLNTFSYLTVCPHHPAGAVSGYLEDHHWRKPSPGMIHDLMEHWPVQRDSSFVIGDRASDIEAAAAAGLPGFLFPAGDLDAFVVNVLLQTSLR
jgi:HAD-hyrolase-like